jgi:ATP:ADP antiporter, AAA family
VRVSNPPSATIPARFEEGSARKSWLDRTLSLFTEVQPGEGTTALLLAANLFCLLAFYYILKTVREALILSEGGAEVKSYSAALQALLLFAFVPAYSRLAARMDRIRLIFGVTLFFASHLVIFYLLGAAGVRIGIVFFVWIGIFNLVVPAQLFAFANDIYTHDRGKRLLPLVGLGSSLGAMAGAGLAAVLFSRLGPYPLLVLSATGLVACLAFTSLVDRREQRRDAAAAKIAQQPIGGTNGFRLVFSQRYLLLIAVLIVLLNIVNSVGEFILGKLVTSHVKELVATGQGNGLSESVLIGSFYASYFSWVNALGLFIQLVLVSRIFKFVGVRGAMYFLPAIACVSYGVFALFPVLALVRITKILENSTDYSLQNTLQQALFLPTSRDAKYKAKAAIDTFFVRLGDILSAALVFVSAMANFSPKVFAGINAALALMWLGVMIGVAREHRKRTTVEKPMPGGAATAAARA